MFIKEKFEQEIAVKGSDKPVKKEFVEIQKPDGDTVVLEVKDGKTKSEGANKLLAFEAKKKEREEKPKAKAKSKAKAKAK